MKPGCHSDRAPRKRLPRWSVSDRCGAWIGRSYMSEQHIAGCEGCAYRYHIPRESWLRYWWREKRDKLTRWL